MVMIPALASLHVGDQPGVGVGVDGRLPAGHCIEGEPSANLGDSLGTLRDHHELDHEQDEEDHHADDDRAAERDMTERADQLPRVAVAERETCRGDIEVAAEQRCTSSSERNAEKSGGFLTNIVVRRDYSTIRIFVLDAAIYLPDYSPETSDEHYRAIDLHGAGDALGLIRPAGAPGASRSARVTCIETTRRSL